MVIGYLFFWVLVISCVLVAVDRTIRTISYDCDHCGRTHFRQAYCPHCGAVATPTRI